MTNVTQYFRPREIADAFRLLGHPGAVVVGGGTEVFSSPNGEPIEVVDLQALGLDEIEERGPRTLRIGSMASLQTLADHGLVPIALRDAARREVPSTLRSQATLGGTVCGTRRDSGVVAALLLHEAFVEVRATHTRHEIPLAVLLGGRMRLANQIVTAVTVDPSGVTASAQTGRTRADRPIVAVYGRRRRDGSRLLVLTGVAEGPLVIDGQQVALKEALERTRGWCDFRGSLEFRHTLAEVLSRRVLERLGR